MLNQRGDAWGTGLVRPVFNDLGAETILKLKLPTWRSEDFLGWNYKKKGKFSVKSAYSLAMNRKQK